VCPPVCCEALLHALREHGQLWLDQLQDTVPVSTVGGFVCEDRRLRDPTGPVENDRKAQLHTPPRTELR
jgi:hypothetical protein